MSMRLILGVLKGRRIKIPSRARPLPASVKEAVFQILSLRLNLEGSLVIDLFAGSGSLSFEALSLGAGYAVAVDRDPQAVHLIRENAQVLGLSERVVSIRGDVLSTLKGRGRAGKVFLKVLREKLGGSDEVVVFNTPPFKLWKLAFPSTAELLKVLLDNHSGMGKRVAVVMQLPKHASEGELMSKTLLEGFNEWEWSRRVYGDNAMVFMFGVL